MEGFLWDKYYKHFTSTNSCLAHNLEWKNSFRSHFIGKVHKGKWLTQGRELLRSLRWFKLRQSDPNIWMFSPKAVAVSRSYTLVIRHFQWLSIWVMYTYIRQVSFQGECIQPVRGKTRKWTYIHRGQKIPKVKNSHVMSEVGCLLSETMYLWVLGIHSLSFRKVLS